MSLYHEILVVGVRTCVCWWFGLLVALALEMGGCVLWCKRWE